MTKHYESLFSWESFYSDTVLRHQDGSLSVAIEWEGVDSSLTANSDIAQLYENIRAKLNTIPENIVIEQHLLRDYGADLIDSYIELSNKSTVRCHEVGRFIKEEMVLHLDDNAMTNRCIMVLTVKRQKKPLFDLFSAKQYLKSIDEMAETLEKVTNNVISHFKGTLLNKEQWAQFVIQCSYPSLFSNEQAFVNDDYFLYEQWIKQKPVLENGCLKIDKHYIKTALLLAYPDADVIGDNIGFGRRFSNLNHVQTHITHVLQRVNKVGALDKSNSRSKYAKGFANEKNQERVSSQLNDESMFRAEIERGAEVYKNAYIITLSYTDSDYLNQTMDYIKGYLQGKRADLRYSDESQLSYFRYCLPAQGSFVPWMREDTDSMVANLLPCQKYNQGDTEYPQMLRKTVSGELVAKGFRPNAVNHAITVAATGAGKGVQKCAEILETFPMGINWYIAEVGTSYQWTVEAVGGTYVEIDPNITCINPLPSVDTVLASSKGLDSDVILGTVSSLAFLLVDGEHDLTVHQKAAAQFALESLYHNITATSKQPLLSDFLGALKNNELFINDGQREAAQFMSANLESFLVSAEGRVFNQETNLQLHDGIFAVNLKPVQKNAPALLKFYFVFIGLAYMQFAYASGQPSRVLLDEMHVLVEQAPSVAKRLISGISRMGRKEGAASDLVTQETAEIDAIEPAVINQTPYYNLLWRKAEWEHIKSRLNMPDAVLQKWKSWQDPISTKLPYRDCMSLILGRYYELRLSFPESLMLISSSDESDLTAKPFIGNLTQDLQTRLKLLLKYREVLETSNSHQQAQIEVEKHFRKDAA